MTTYPNINDTDYFTNRPLENEKGEKKGKILMWRMIGKKEFHLVLKCPYCEYQQEREEIFEKRPYRPVCEKCGKSITISRLKSEK